MVGRIGKDAKMGIQPTANKSKNTTIRRRINKKLSGGCGAHTMEHYTAS